MYKFADIVSGNCPKLAALRLLLFRMLLDFSRKIIAFVNSFQSHSFCFVFISAALMHGQRETLTAVIDLLSSFSNWTNDDHIL